MAKSIPLTQGKFAIVDDGDFEYLNQFKWQFLNGYAARSSSILFGKRYKIFMHREILKTPGGLFTDHINGNKLDNRKDNLRICNKSQNRTNSGIDPTNTSGYKGVVWDKGRSVWVARITLKDKQKHLGYFDNPAEAADAYDKAAIIYFGEFAKTNKDIKENK